VGDFYNERGAIVLVKVCDLKDWQREFIGTTFETESGGILTVIGAIDKHHHTQGNLFLLHCSKCSEDLELFPNGRLISDKKRLLKGRFPCNCNENFKGSPKQRKVIAKRLAENKGYKLLSLNKGVAILYCKVCSLDRELWPEGSIRVNVSKLKAGHMHCGCSKSVKYTERQNRVRVERECLSRGDTKLLSWAEPYKGVKTKLKLQKVNSGFTWTTTSIDGFIRGKGGLEDKSIKIKKAKQKPLSDILNKAISIFDNIIEVRKPETFDNKYDKECIEYRCDVCSRDKFTLSGTCNGWFKLRLCDLMRGRIACRCSTRYRWSIGQQELKISELCEKEGLCFLGWCGEGYKTAETSRISWECSCGKVNETSFQNFIKRGRRCRGCATHGFRTDRSAELYLVRWFCGGKTFLKYGITNRKALERIKQQRDKTNGLVFEVLYIFKSDDGELIKGCEDRIKQLNKVGFVNKSQFPDGYTETLKDTKSNINFVLTVCTGVGLIPVKRDE
jgi:hypothetical protein